MLQIIAAILLGLAVAFVVEKMFGKTQGVYPWTIAVSVVAGILYCVAASINPFTGAFLGLIGWGLYTAVKVILISRDLRL